MKTIFFLFFLTSCSTMTFHEQSAYALKTMDPNFVLEGESDDTGR